MPTNQTPVNFTTIDLFCGGGGSYLSFKWAGFDCVLANDIKPTAVNLLKHNFPEANVVLGDVALIDFKPYNGKVDVVLGGFPCQSWSAGGKQEGFNDPRGQLFYQCARVLDETKPKMFAFENVANLLTHNNGESLRIIRGHFKDQGYKTLIKVFNANDYGVPQSRHRLIIYGIRNDLDYTLFELPTPINSGTTVGDALYAGTLHNTDSVNDFEGLDKRNGYIYSERRARIMSGVPEGGDYRNLTDDDRKEWLGAMYESTKHKKLENREGSSGVARRLSRNKPAPTLLCCPIYKRGEMAHPLHNRPISVREAARIQSFPDSYRFDAPKNSASAAYEMLGNSWAPVFAYHALALPVKKFLEKLANNQF